MRIAKFAAVGATGVVVNLAVFTLAKWIWYPLLGQTDLALLLSSLSGDEVSILSNFALNHRWTFGDTRNPSHITVKLAQFHAISIAGVLINNAVLFGLHKYFGWWDTLAKLTGILIAFLWNFTANRRWTWGGTIT